jgi:NitT/TauT family transport system permease protein
MTLLALRGHLKPNQANLIQGVGFVLILSLWVLVCQFMDISPSILPHPFMVIKAFGELHFEDALLRNLGFSIKINLWGYFEAILISLPLGFIIGLFPLFREAFRKYIDAFRFIPLTALTGLFIAWFGIEEGMKIQFLAFGIIVYLLPIVVQRIEEVDQIYIDTVYTLGANKFQTITSVFIPAVLQKISDDIRIITSISWTYVIVAEVINKTEGGIGALIFTSARQSRIDKVFALLVIIVAIGFIQDKALCFLDRLIFPSKYAKEVKT